nr:TIGR03960 family B12-binding radical SAM protein [Lachnospiraceae bacterium]
MRKLFLSDEILMSVEKSARYIGNEVNSVKKDPSSVDLRFCMCFPDVYEIGMSHLGIQILYEMMNRREDVYCERVYSPWPDLHKIMKEKDIPLFALETQEPIKNFDMLGITLQYEMCYTNILQILDLSQIPLLTKNRSDSDPIIIGGGPCVYNPEPIAPFFDILYIGEGETSYDELFDLYIGMKKEGNFHREEFLRKASNIPGLYVPSLYEVTYKEDGTIEDFYPIYEDVPKTVKRQVVTDMDSSAYPTKPIVPFVQATQDRAVLEIQRGCIRGCRFCQAGMIYRPNRERSYEVLKDYAKEILASTGHDEISLSSLSSSDYTQLPELVNFLIDDCCKDGVNISLPSLRIDAFSLDVMSKVQDIKKSSVTFAPEAGSQRMRNVINKGLTVEDILGGAEKAFIGGWNKVKLYFMLGLPSETEEDMKAIPMLGNEIAALYYETVPKEKRNGKCQITMSTSFFVPKPFTPFQWARMYTKDEYLHRAKIVNDTMKEQLNHKSLRYQWHHADVTVLEGIFARGDRKVADVILYAYEHGQYFDAWGEFFDVEKWDEAFRACNVDPDFYIMRERDIDEVFPWDFIDCGVTKKFLQREWLRSKEEKVTKN